MAAEVALCLFDEFAAAEPVAPSDVSRKIHRPLDSRLRFRALPAILVQPDRAYWWVCLENRSKTAGLRVKVCPVTRCVGRSSTAPSGTNSEHERPTRPTYTHGSEAI